MRASHFIAVFVSNNMFFKRSLYINRVYFNNGNKKNTEKHDTKHLGGQDFSRLILQLTVAPIFFIFKAMKKNIKDSNKFENIVF